MDNYGNRTITSANAVVTIRAQGLYDAPVRLEGFATDAIVNPAQVNSVVAEMGADGHLSFGYTPQPQPVTFSFQADSPSRQIMEDLCSDQRALGEVVIVQVEAVLPGIGRKYTGTRGAVTAEQPGSPAAQTLQSSQYTITFESWVGSDL